MRGKWAIAISNFCYSSANTTRLFFSFFSLDRSIPPPHSEKEEEEACLISKKASPAFTFLSILSLFIFNPSSSQSQSVLSLSCLLTEERRERERGLNMTVCDCRRRPSFLGGFYTTHAAASHAGTQLVYYWLLFVAIDLLYFDLSPFDPKTSEG